MDQPAVLLVPQKDLDQAKSRMLLAPERRRAVAVALLRRALQAASAASFGAVMVVLDNAADADEFADLDAIPFHPAVPGLNPSLCAAESAVRGLWGAVPIAVMPADLPLVTPALLDRALSRARRHDRAFIPDRAAEGTTMLFAGPHAPLRPTYGPQSAFRHQRQGAHILAADDLRPLRHDVDDLSDLAVANLRFEPSERWEETG